ncbi:hypothetical protein [Nonomuraea dietziae]|uniref:hypothetical protein n=1 Tax=Nonomuraea dietziae TaxID=65515 RepID=UPI00340420FA
MVRADTLTATEHLRAAGVTDVVLHPTSSGLEQVELLADALHAAGFPLTGG